MGYRRQVAPFLISRGTGCEEYSNLLASSHVRVIKETDFATKDDVIRIVDYEDRRLPQFDDQQLVVPPVPPPIC